MDGIEMVASWTGSGDQSLDENESGIMVEMVCG